MGIYLSQEGVARVAQIGSCFMWVASFIYPNEHNMNFA